MSEFDKENRKGLVRNDTHERLARFAKSLTASEIGRDNVAHSVREVSLKLSPGDSGLTSRSDLSTDAGARDSGGESAPNLNAGRISTSVTDMDRARAENGQWDNPLIGAVIPTLLHAERVRGQAGLDVVQVRLEFVRDIQLFRQNLLSFGVATSDAANLTYLLCSYIDECSFGRLEAGGLNLSLLVEFYRDAWGGEKSFEHLQQYMTTAPANKDILGFYDLILSLGFEGKFRVIDRGALLLIDLRNQLNRSLYNYSTQTLSDVGIEKVTHDVHWLTPSKLFGCGALLVLLVYAAAAWSLHSQSQPLRNTILAWTPPMPRKVNIMETLPHPLPKILSEGWLEVRPDPRGWLLIFTSDGAFASGQPKLLDAFVKNRNIERLGDALAAWPGDLEVIGHTDNRPYRNAPANANLKLSEARAQVVADKLRKSLLNSKYQRFVTSVGKGESEPLDTNDSEEGRLRNRRVDVLWKIGERLAAGQNRTGIPAASQED